MKGQRFNNLLAAVVVVAIGVFGVILYPQIRINARQMPWWKSSIAPQSFKNAELKDVVGKLNGEMVATRKMSFLKNLKWDSSNLKHRKVTFDTQDGQTLRQVLATIETKAGVSFKYGGTCGICGLPMTEMAIVDLTASNDTPVQLNPVTHG
ncbi:hypothetical protein EON83_00240 [bacterium]|nr:MAG: hypothetical protein EON83_00240 [bacterium]